MGRVNPLRKGTRKGKGPLCWSLVLCSDGVVVRTELKLNEGSIDGRCLEPT